MLVLNGMNEIEIPFSDSWKDTFQFLSIITNRTFIDLCQKVTIQKTI